ncbi:hypothetical protein ATJ93_2017 [Halopiger aswanensis]|uniref:Uncharacterized protein n=1 Tax=Halopiger aswanensis TaxID=148449 RepID=A0A419WI91_9EURY|nr:hypothetical protein ATJ93_2017 [Halopiger aswanensis]
MVFTFVYKYANAALAAVHPGNAAGRLRNGPGPFEFESRLLETSHSIRGSGTATPLSAD